MSTRRGREPQGLRPVLLRLRGVYSPTHYYVGVSRAAILHRHGPSSQALGLSSQALGLASQALDLASWIELPEVLDVPGVLDRYPVLCLQVHGARPGDVDDLERALPHGQELMSPSLESTRLRMRSPTSRVLEQTLR